MMSGAGLAAIPRSPANGNPFGPCFCTPTARCASSPPSPRSRCPYDCRGGAVKAVSWSTTWRCGGPRPAYRRTPVLRGDELERGAGALVGAARVRQVGLSTRDRGGSSPSTHQLLGLSHVRRKRWRTDPSPHILGLGLNLFVTNRALPRRAMSAARTEV